MGTREGATHTHTHTLPGEVQGKWPRVYLSSCHPLKTNVSPKNWRTSKIIHFLLLPRSLTWNLKISPWKRRFLLETVIFRWTMSNFGGVFPVSLWRGDIPSFSVGYKPFWSNFIARSWAPISVAFGKGNGTPLFQKGLGGSNIIPCGQINIIYIHSHKPKPKMMSLRLVYNKVCHIIYCALILSCKWLRYQTCS